MIINYLISVLIINVMIFAGCIWAAVICWRSGSTYLTYGTLLFSLSYAGLVGRNVMLIHNKIIGLTLTEIHLSYFIYIIQLAAVICFVVYGEFIRNKK